jgi:mono/diheme cytochrome c family protein
MEARGSLVKRHIAIAAGLATLGSLLANIGHVPAIPVTPSGLEQGRAIYERHCASCHGPEGKGDGQEASSLSPRPGNLISAQTSAKSDQELLKIIGKGRPRTAMTGWDDRLSPEEQSSVLAYIRSLVKFTRSATPPPPQR